MKLHRLIGSLQLEYYLTLHSLEIVVDVFLYPLMSIVVFGFISLYISQSNHAIAQNVLLGIFLWQIVSISQYCITMLSLWTVWSRNLSNLFITPLRVEEFLLAAAISSLIKSCIVFLLGALIASFVFHFSVFSIGITTIIAVWVNLVLFAFTVGVFILGLIFRYGSRIQALAWGLVPFFQPLSAAFYPVSVLPSFLQKISYALPPTYAFEAARYGLTHSSVNWQLLLIGFLQNCLYLFLSFRFFNRMFRLSKLTGQFSRMEG